MLTHALKILLRLRHFYLSYRSLFFVFPSLPTYLLQELYSTPIQVIEPISMTKSLDSITRSYLENDSHSTYNTWPLQFFWHINTAISAIVRFFSLKPFKDQLNLLHPNSAHILRAVFGPCKLPCNVLCSCKRPWLWLNQINWKSEMNCLINSSMVHISQACKLFIP